MWDQFKEFLRFQFLAVPVWRIVAAIGFIVVAWAVKKLALKRLVGVLLHVASKTKTDLDDLLVQAVTAPLGSTVILAGFYLGAEVIQFPNHPVDVQGFVRGLFRTIMIIIVAWALYRAVRVVTVMLERLTAKTESNLDDQLVPFAEKFLKATVIVLAVVMVVREWGYDISGLLAGLGLGGLAFALAAKDMLANVFGSVMILTDRPFAIGDWIKTPQVEGTVEEIGFRSTKVRTFANSLVSVPNSIIASNTVENWSRMHKRRISYKLGVTYGTTVAQMREAVERIKDVISEHPGIRQDFWLVYFTDFNDSSLDIMIYCFTETTVWGEYLAVRQDLNLKIFAILEEIGVQVAFPSQSIYMENDEPNERKKWDDVAGAALESRQEPSHPSLPGRRGNEAAVE
ncbi:MAG: mechanosensitive ion channel family protein [Deltaproteobacteria bacterium]|nr:mechanosensitive ion channel family protein [Deltaproteobacteria bacterium]